MFFSFPNTFAANIATRIVNPMHPIAISIIAIPKPAMLIPAIAANPANNAPNPPVKTITANANTAMSINAKTAATIAIIVAVVISLSSLNFCFVIVNVVKLLLFVFPSLYTLKIP